MSEYDPLTKLLRQAGVKPCVALNIRSALVADQVRGGSPQDVADALMRWKDKVARQAYARGEHAQRARSAVAASELLASAGAGYATDEDALQCFLFEQLPEVTDSAAVEADGSLPAEK